jgi:Arc/MetJ-type ribon-helix-helix transcriptional regulator
MSESETRSGGDAVRLTIRLSPEARAALEEVVRLGKLRNVQDAVRRAIGDELFLQQQMADDWKVVLQKDNKYREVVWPKF